MLVFDLSSDFQHYIKGFLVVLGSVVVHQCFKYFLLMFFDLIGFNLEAQLALPTDISLYLLLRAAHALVVLLLESLLMLLDFILEDQMGVLHLSNLMRCNLAEVDVVPDLVVDFVLNLRQHILHVHDRAIKRQALPTRRIDELPPIHRILLVLLEGRLRKRLQHLVICLLLGIQVHFLVFLHFGVLEILHNVLHIRNLITLGRKLESFVLLVLTLPHVMRQRVADFLVVDITLAYIVLLI